MADEKQKRVEVTADDVCVLRDLIRIRSLGGATAGELQSLSRIYDHINLSRKFKAE